MPDYQIDEIIAAVEALVSDIMGARLTGTRQEQYNQFLGLLQEIDQLENTIEMLEDRVKADYRVGTISREEYRNIDRILDGLDDRLDGAEDELKRIFGMED